jgi:hypothetical protein
MFQSKSTSLVKSPVARRNISCSLAEQVLLMPCSATRPVHSYPYNICWPDFDNEIIALRLSVLDVLFEI